MYLPGIAPLFRIVLGIGILLGLVNHVFSCPLPYAELRFPFLDVKKELSVHQQYFPFESKAFLFLALLI